eukprot:CAMPEP_0117005130 /NCGR_PEP_ID=MMETSP0472-20121206/5861_1 /TAXON_ID=693140 ORGANISM="Tiarina fusus, Strain LIS" /NCGR_SAMPLE_ID=MMETSP0472 /ASSEMBLY_ACC=CAM_ASM_000603 /LENGTH=853 /DNA_ID=CAMNT_0004706293 /DNA_START=42 /DNA_END=2603 /DNA_ORIENTATION=-
MKLALDLLCCSKRIVDTVVAGIPAGAAPAGPKVVSAPDTATVATTEDDEDHGDTSRPANWLADLPHSRVFVYVPAPSETALAGDGFHFVLGSLRMKARYLRGKDATTEHTKVAAVLPQEALPGGLSSRFFSANARLPDPIKLYVKAPPDLQVGETFEVSLLGQRIQIRGPKGMISSDPQKCTRKFLICCPRKRAESKCQLLQFQLKGASFCNCDACGGIKMPENEKHVRRIANSSPAAFLVTVPTGIKPNDRFPVVIQGQQFLVTCPSGGRPGQPVRIVLPILGGCTRAPETPPKKQTTTQLFEVKVPEGTKPGSDFCVLAGGNRALITCPENAGPEQRIRFRLPVPCTVVEPVHGAAPEGMTAGQWTMAVRAKDLKLQWVPVNGEHSVGTRNGRFSANESVYLRRLEFRPGDDPRFRQGVVSMVPAEKVALDTEVKKGNDEGSFVVKYADILLAQRKAFHEKADWLHEACADLTVPWNEGSFLRLNVRREHILEDSFQGVMSLSRRDMRKVWRVEFIGESGIEEGGLIREWYQSVCNEIMDPRHGLWKPSEADPSRMAICGPRPSPQATSPASESIQEEDWPLYYRFFGRVMGKALFDRQIIPTGNRLEKHIYKFLLQWPLQFKDLEFVDPAYFASLKHLQDLADRGEDVSMMCLDFTTTELCNGIRREVELVKGGADMEVTNENLPEFIEACFKHKLMGGAVQQPQLTELLLGFADVIPQPLLTVFDIQEFESLLHGVDDIRVDAFAETARYSGAFQRAGAEHPTCRLFWDTVSEMECEIREWLFTSVTGSSPDALEGGKVPRLILRGVANGALRIGGNQIDLPLRFHNKKELGDALWLLAKRPAQVIVGK